MTDNVLSLKSGATHASAAGSRRRKIQPSQWPDILARRDEGASQARIAEEYGVSQGTISQILKRATRSSEEPAAAAAETPPANDRGDKDGATPPASTGAASPSSPLAERLRTAAERCASLIDAGEPLEADIAEAAHEVRRALAAIEIDAARRASPADTRDRPHDGGPLSDLQHGDDRFGRIKFFKPEKGFGFIIPDDGGDDVFLGKDTAQAAGLMTLNQGDRVAFRSGPGAKGLEAKSVQLAP